MQKAMQPGRLEATVRAGITKLQRKRYGLCSPQGSHPVSPELWWEHVLRNVEKAKSEKSLGGRTAALPTRSLALLCDFS